MKNCTNAKEELTWLQVPLGVTVSSAGPPGWRDIPDGPDEVGHHQYLLTYSGNTHRQYADDPDTEIRELFLSNNLVCSSDNSPGRDQIAPAVDSHFRGSPARLHGRHALKVKDLHHVKNVSFSNHKFISLNS